MRKRGAGVHGVWCGVAGPKGAESLFAGVNHFSYSHCDWPVFYKGGQLFVYLNKQQDRTERNQASYWRLYKGGQLISLTFKAISRSLPVMEVKETKFFLNLTHLPNMINMECIPFMYLLTVD